MARADSTSQVRPMRIPRRQRHVALRMFLRACRSAAGVVLALRLPYLGALEAQDFPAQEEAPSAALVHLRDIDASILQDIRYAGPNNFTGRPVAGYAAPECLLLRDVAEALSRVQDELRQRKLSLKVYDCYRPRRAVRAFRDWVQDPEADPLLKRFHPESGKEPVDQSRLHCQRVAALARRYRRPDPCRAACQARAGLQARHRLRPLRRPGRGARSRQQHRHGHELRLLRSAQSYESCRTRAGAGAVAAKCWWMPWRDRGSTTITRSGGISRTCPERSGRSFDVPVTKRQQ